MKSKKSLSLLLVLAMLTMLLTGCIYSQTDSVIHNDGSGTICFATGLLADEGEEPEEGKEVFEVNGNKYYGESKTVSFSSAEEFSKVFAALTEEESGDDAENGSPLSTESSISAALKRNSDGSLTLVFSLSKAEEDEASSEETPDLSGLTEEEQKELEELDYEAIAKEMEDTMWIRYTFAFDLPVRQLAGPSAAVSIEGGKVTIEPLKQAEDEIYSTYVFITNVESKVVPTAQKLSVNGAAKETEIYNINGANYFKLRDMAALLNGTSGSFSVDYDAASKSILVKKGEAYQAAGGELVIPDAGELSNKAAGAQKSAQSMLIDGEPVYLAPYNIGGNNFFALRDLASVLNFSVDYDEATRTMLVTTK